MIVELSLLAVVFHVSSSWLFVGCDTLPDKLVSQDLSRYEVFSPSKFAPFLQRLSPRQPMAGTGTKPENLLFSMTNFDILHKILSKSLIVALEVALKVFLKRNPEVALREAPESALRASSSPGSDPRRGSSGPFMTN